jgi:TPP-dependent pyruvate/acetoin dehydrogenase alpha subunit
VLALHERSRDLVAKIRSGFGPWFIEVMTYRWTEHVGPGEDFHLGYRDAAEAEPWRENDQLRRLAEMIAPAERTRLEDDVEAEIADAFGYAEASAYPDGAELLEHVYKD